MYPDTLKKNVEEDLAAVEARLRKELGCIIPSGMVDTLDSADAAGRKFRDENIDTLIIVEGTYIPDFITLHAINYVKHVPVLFFSIQMEENVDAGSNYEHSLRNSGMIGVAQLTGTFCKMGRPYELVVGSVHDDRAYCKIHAYVQALQAIADVRECNIGIIGHVFRGMYDLELSKTFLKSKFDANIIYIQNSHLLELWEKVTENEIKELADGLISRFAMRGITYDDVYRACRLAVAMRKLSDKFKLDAMCFLDQHYVQKQTLTSARIGASLLMEYTDVVATCEGDLGGLIMMLIMRSISGKPALMGEWGEYDIQNNCCFIIGHGIGTPGMACSDSDVTLTRTPEEWGFEGAGLNYEYILRPGAATIGHLIETPSGYKMLVSPVESIPYKTFSYEEIHAMLRVKQPVKQYLENILGHGVAHHCIIGMGDMSAPLKHITKLLNLEMLYQE
jgi:L-arabinose isomerase